MRKYQMLGHALIPSSISFLLLQLYLELTNASERNISNYLTLLLIIGILVILIRWLQNKETLQLYIGFHYLKHEIWFPLYTVYFMSLLWLQKWFQPEAYRDINSLYLLAFMLLFYAISTYIRKQVLVTTTFIKITSEHYFDLTYFEIHTREEIEKYNGIKTLQEDLFIENLLLIEKHCKNKKGQEVSVSIEETPEGIILSYIKEGKEYTTMYQKTELSEAEKQKVSSIIRRIA